MINYGTGEKSAVSQESVSGAFPPLPGIYRMRVVSQGNYVSIYPAVLDMSKASISVNMGQNDSRQVLLGFSKSSREAVNVTIASNWGITDIGFSLNQSTFTVGDLGASAALSFVGGTNATGIYASSLTINATGVETGTTEMILFPIVVAVQAG